MYIKLAVTFKMFSDYFAASQYADNFTHNGLVTLYDYLLEHECEDGTNYELCISDLAQRYNEYQSVDDYNEQNNTEHDEWYDIDGELIITYGDGFLVNLGV